VNAIGIKADDYREKVVFIQQFEIGGDQLLLKRWLGLPHAITGYKNYCFRVWYGHFSLLQNGWYAPNGRNCQIKNRRWLTQTAVLGGEKEVSRKDTASATPGRVQHLFQAQTCARLQHSGMAVGLSHGGIFLGGKHWKILS
jgi:hypothetical protein